MLNAIGTYIGSRVPGGFVGPMDIYGNNALAYSVRRLYNTSTFAITVRRTDNEEQNIGFDAFGNLDTSALLSFCGVGDGFVTRWYDQGNLAIHVENGGAENQPKIVSAGVVNIDNGKPAILFNSKFLATAVFSNIPQPQSHFSVTNVPNTGINLYDGQFDDSFSAIRSFFKNIQFYVGGSPVMGNNEYNLNDQNLVYALFNTSNHEMIVNNTAKTTSTNVVTAGLTRLMVGAAGGTFYRANGNYQELIIFRSNQINNQENIRSNINTYYGIY